MPNMSHISNRWTNWKEQKAQIDDDKVWYQERRHWCGVMLLQMSSQVKAANDYEAFISIPEATFIKLASSFGVQLIY